MARYPCHFGRYNPKKEVFSSFACSTDVEMYRNDELSSNGPWFSPPAGLEEVNDSLDDTYSLVQSNMSLRTIRLLGSLFLCLCATGEGLSSTLVRKELKWAMKPTVTMSFCYREHWAFAAHLTLLVSALLRDKSSGRASVESRAGSGSWRCRILTRWHFTMQDKGMNQEMIGKK